MHFCTRDGRSTVLVFFQIAEIYTSYNSIIKVYAFLLVGLHGQSRLFTLYWGLPIRVALHIHWNNDHVCMLMNFSNFELFQLRTFPTSNFSNFELFQLRTFPTSNFSNPFIPSFLNLITLLKPSPLQLAACVRFAIEVRLSLSYVCDSLPFIFGSTWSFEI